MTTELYYQARQIYKMFPDWKFSTIVERLNKSQFLNNSFEHVVQSRMSKKRKYRENGQNFRKKVCSTNIGYVNKLDKPPTDCGSVIVISSESDESTDSEVEELSVSEEIDPCIKDNIACMFPECDPFYIEFLIVLATDSLSGDKNLLVDHIVSRLINEDYPKWKSEASPDFVYPLSYVEQNQKPIDLVYPLPSNEQNQELPDLIKSTGDDELILYNRLIANLSKPVQNSASNQVSSNTIFLPESSNNVNTISEENILYQDLSNPSISLDFSNVVAEPSASIDLTVNKNIAREITEVEFLPSSSSFITVPQTFNSIDLGSTVLNNDADQLSIFNDFNSEFFDDSFDEFLQELEKLDQHILEDKKSVHVKPVLTNINPLVCKTETDTNMDQVENIVLKLLPIFPDACPTYLRKFCQGYKNTPKDLEEIITQLIGMDFPKRIVKKDRIPEPELDEEKQYEIMLELLPDADPTYLRVHCSNLYNQPDNLKMFIDDALENKNYPTLNDYKRKQQTSAQMKQYTTEFNVNKFLELIPNPDEYFNDPKRACTYSTNGTTNIQKSFAIHAHMKDVFKNMFVNLRIQDINYAIKQNCNKVIPTYKQLKKSKDVMKRPRKQTPFQQLYGDIDVPYMQEIAYITHIDEINRALTQRKLEKLVKFENAKTNNLLLQCNCCYDDEVMEEDTSTCGDGHVFCNACIIRSIEIAFGENKLQFLCLAECNAEFSLAVLQKILKPNMFSKIALRKQIEEVKSAGIEELESCPFCDFATIPTPGDKIFKCLNEECMKESCRQCREPSHIPYRCDEIENNDEVKARIYIEDKMTEALLRKCWKCGMKFIKEDGCNKMTCQCGAFMCYVCGKPVEGYKHFNGQGGTNFELCPLYSDTEKLHVDAVRKIGEQAKQEVKEKNPAVQLKYDPLTGLPETKEKDTVYKPGPGYDPFEEHRFNNHNHHNHNHHNHNHNRHNHHHHNDERHRHDDRPVNHHIYNQRIRNADGEGNRHINHVPHIPHIHHFHHHVVHPNRHDMLPAATFIPRANSH